MDDKLLTGVIVVLGDISYLYLAFNDIWKVAESPKATSENTKCRQCVNLLASLMCPEIGFSKES